MTELYVMCGCPGSGKSTWIKRRTQWMPDDMYAIVSRDDIRLSMLGEKDKYFDHEDEVYDVFIFNINDAIKTRDYVFVDATHLTRKSRRRLLKRLDLEDCRVTAVNFGTEFEDCLARNRERTGKRRIPVEVIKQMYMKFEPATNEEEFIDYVIWDND